MKRTIKIRTRLSLLYTFLTAGILLIFASIVYFSASKQRKKEFLSLLRKEAITKANLILDARVDAETLQQIYRSNREILNEVEVAIYNQYFELVYHDAVDIDFVKETPQMLGLIMQMGEIHFDQERWQVLGIRYAFAGEDFLITAAAYDQYGYNKLRSLLRTMLIVYVLSIIMIYFTGRYFSKKAFAPVREMTEKARKISATNLDLRLAVIENGDEISELANTFNEMLSRLENSFEAQKMFVSNISHELRTPLAAMVTELELALSSTPDAEIHKTSLPNLLGDARRMIRLINSLLDFAKASYDHSKITFRDLRIDELLLDARQQILHNNPNYRIELSFEAGSENGMEIYLHGNEYLLRTAFANLMENGCKFSHDNTSTVVIGLEKSDHLVSPPGYEHPDVHQKPAHVGESYSEVIIHFIDHGIGIPEEETDKIFTPFYRGSNKHFADGNGIGLSLAKKIVQLHKGTIFVKSVQGKGTTFILRFPVTIL